MLCSQAHDPIQIAEFLAREDVRGPKHSTRPAVILAYGIPVWQQWANELDVVFPIHASAYAAPNQRSPEPWRSPAGS